MGSPQKRKNSYYKCFPMEHNLNRDFVACYVALSERCRSLENNGTERALKPSDYSANPLDVWIVRENDRFMKLFPLSRGKVTNTRPTAKGS